MAIGGLSNNSSAGVGGASSIRGYGGLASGLDRDTLIEQMTYGTRSKIAKQQQAKTKLGWEQEAIRDITNKVYDFTNKYTSYSSATNLSGSNLFSRSLITALGDNSKYVGVTGKSNSSDMLSILGIKQMAKDAKIMGDQASTSILNTGNIKNDFSETVAVNKVENQILTIKHGNRSYNVRLGSGSDYDYENDLAGAINKSLDNIDIGGDKKLSSVLQASMVGGKLQFENLDTAGNSIELVNGTGDALKYLGFLDEGEKIEDLGEDALVFGNGGTVTGKNAAEPIIDVAITDFIAGKTMRFSYNGTTKDITISSGLNSITDLQNDLQSQLDSAFGSKRVQVNLVPGAASGSSNESILQFKTIKPDGSQDTSSMLSIVNADQGLLGKAHGIFGIEAGGSNRINTSESLLRCGASNSSNVNTNDPAELIINGKVIQGVTWNSSVNEIIEAVNKSDAGVKMSYQASSDRFLIASTEKGASGEVNLQGNIAEYLLGTTATTNPVKGQDAVIMVQYGGDSAPTEITRDSNSFSIDGLTMNLKGTFGYTGDILDGTAEPVTFDARVDSEKTTGVVKEMIEAFNEILKQIYTEVDKKPNRNYAPLTDEQKAEMSESEIEKWEEKAKEGLLFNDTDLSSFASGLRFMIAGADSAAFQKIGISVSTNYADNGKLVFDEAKFQAALEDDPEAVMELFTRKAQVDENGKEVVAAGLMSKMAAVMKTYAGTSGFAKGILVERAGSVHAPTTVLQNNLQKQMDAIDGTIKDLQKKLKTETDRYIRQFTTLETLISQMNSQSSYLSQMSGGF